MQQVCRGQGWRSYYQHLGSFSFFWACQALHCMPPDLAFPQHSDQAPRGEQDKTVSAPLVLSVPLVHCLGLLSFTLHATSPAFLWHPHWGRSHLEKLIKQAWSYHSLNTEGGASGWIKQWWWQQGGSGQIWSQEGIISGSPVSYFFEAAAWKRLKITGLVPIPWHHITHNIRKLSLKPCKPSCNIPHWRKLYFKKIG